MTPDKETPDETLADEVIDRLYEVAVDPTRYEALLDRWEAMIGPQRLSANEADEPSATRIGLKQFEGHVQRAEQVLDRVFSEPGHVGSVEAALGQIDRVAAFAADRSLTVIGANMAAASALGITKGAAVSGIALEEGEAELLAAQINRLFGGNAAAAPMVVRARGSRSDRIVVFHLRLIRPDAGTPYVLAITSEMGWPTGFDEVLRRAFDLTRAETEVVRAMAEGQSLADIATDRGRSLDTIRAQLKSIMSKTETRTQAELVRLTLSTMEMTHFSDVAIANVPQNSTGFDTLVPRPFQRITTADGRRLDYLILGDPHGLPIFFFPLDYGLVRWPASAEAEAARRGIRIVVPIRPGYGNSTSLPKGTPYMAQLVDDMIALMDHLGIRRMPFVTMGGDSLIAMALHAAYPERINALIACAGVLPMTRRVQYERMDKWHRFILAGARYTPHLLPFMVKAGFALARRLGKRGFVHAVYGDSKADVATFEIPEVFEAMVCGSEVSLSETHSAHDAFSREVIHHETTDWTAEVAALKGSIPVHFLNGLQDPQVPPGTLAEFREDYPWIDFRVYPDAGQLLFFLKWRDVLGLVTPYLLKP